MPTLVALAHSIVNIWDIVCRTRERPVLLWERAGRRFRSGAAVDPLVVSHLLMIAEHFRHSL